MQLAVLLAATERMVFGTSIANIWARAPQTAHGAAALLSQAFPDRFVLGLGVGYPHQAATVDREFGRPVGTMREYLDRMGAPTQLPAPDVAYPKIIGANGPKMLALSGEIADGAMPAMVPPEFTAQARQVLGPDKLLVVGLAVAADTDPERAKATARQTVAGRLAAPGTYAATMARLGYSEQEIAEVSDRLLDALVGLTSYVLDGRVGGPCPRDAGLAPRRQQRSALAEKVHVAVGVAVRRRVGVHVHQNPLRLRGGGVPDGVVQARGQGQRSD